MTSARVEGIFIGHEEKGPISEISEVSAVAGRGLEGDRYFRTDDADGDPTEEITLFEAEAITQTNDETDLEVVPTDMRRNIMTSGLTLLELIGKRVRIGEAIVEPMEDNPPCKYLEGIIGKEILKPMIRKGGVRGRIIQSGTIRKGDAIEVLEVSQAETG